MLDIRVVASNKARIFQGVDVLKPPPGHDPKQDDIYIYISLVQCHVDLGQLTR